MAKPPKSHAVEVIRHKGPIALPEDMSTEVAIEVLQERAVYDSKQVVITETIDVFPWDGALALKTALEEQFGNAMQTTETVQGLFGPYQVPPKMVSVAISRTQTIQVPWGAFQLAGIPGKVNTGTQQEADQPISFKMVAEVQHRSEKAVRRLFARTREIALAESIYRGRAFAVRFFNAQTGERLEIPQIRFPDITTPPAIFSRDLEIAIETNLLTPIRHSKAVRAAGIPLKRGCLLAGGYGTGKTLTAAHVAREAVANGWTFIYVSEIEELSEALVFASRYQPAVVFAEDVDRAAGRERDDEVNALLNTLDGIGSKASEIMVILTSNHPEDINQAMRRPGRIDIVLEVKAPDAEAAERLMRHYGGDSIDREENITAAGRMLAGQKPAVIREVVERAKLEMIRRTEGEGSEIVCSDLIAAARVLIDEQRLFAPAIPDKSPLERFAAILGESIGDSITRVVDAEKDRL